MRNINSTLNDDCFLSIFAHLSLNEILRLVRPVCKRWFDLVDGNICRRGSRRRILHLCGSKMDCEKYRADSRDDENNNNNNYHHSKNNRKNQNNGTNRKNQDHLHIELRRFAIAADRLPDLLPKVDTLVINYYYSLLEASNSILDDRNDRNATFAIDRLLNAYSNRVDASSDDGLRSLTIIRMIDCVERQRLLFSAIAEQRQSLRKLHLRELFECVHIACEDAKFSSMLGQLSDFALTGYGGDNVPAILRRLSPARLRRLRLETVRLDAREFVRLFAPSQSSLLYTLPNCAHRFASSLTDLALGSLLSASNGEPHDDRQLMKILASVCQHMITLERLEWNFVSEIPFSVLTNELSRLPRLGELNLHLRLCQLQSSLDYYWNEQSAPSTQQFYAPNLALTHLRLFIDGYVSENSLNSLPRVGPNLEQIEIGVRYHIGDKSVEQLERSLWKCFESFSALKMCRLKRVSIRERLN